MIPIADSVLKARDRLVHIVRHELPHIRDEAVSATDGAYPLPLPEVVITTDRDDPVDTWRRFNVARCAAWVYRSANSRYPQIYDGTPYHYHADQFTAFTVAVIFSLGAGFVLPERNGRLQTEREWLQDAAEIYRGALIDTVTGWGFDADAINAVVLVENGSDITEFDGIGLVGRAAITIDVLTGVHVQQRRSVPRPPDFEGFETSANGVAAFWWPYSEPVFAYTMGINDEQWFLFESGPLDGATWPMSPGEYDFTDQPYAEQPAAVSLSRGPIVDNDKETYVVVSGHVLIEALSPTEFNATFSNLFAREVVSYGDPTFKPGGRTWHVASFQTGLVPVTEGVI